MPIISRLKNAWNVFRQNESNFDEYKPNLSNAAASYSSVSPSQPRRVFSNERTIISSIYTRIAIDVAAIVFRHVKFDENDRFSDNVDSPLNDCLTFEPNMDQGPRAFRQDIVLTLFDKGYAAIVPVDTTIEMQSRDIVDIFSLRVGLIEKWLPAHVKVSLYNETKGCREDVTLRKKDCAIVENPLYAVINEINSTYQRLVRKLSILDAVDEQSASGKLDIIIQLPYTVRSPVQKERAEIRRSDIEMQLKDSKYGIAYTDATEKITQLNRPAENNLLKQVDYLVNLLYSQLGITAEVMNGTADEAAMINYFNRTIEPIADAIKEAMQRSFIGPVKAKEREHIHYFKDPFKLVPLGQLAEIADKFTRNEILSSNEIRGAIGYKPSTDPKADQLVNSNMPQADRAQASTDVLSEMDQVVNSLFDGLSSDIDSIISGVGGEGGQG